MREILFRGKRIDSGEWVEGHYGEYMLMSGESIPCISIPNKEAVCGSTCCDVEASTVGQYTGLTDKNGKKVFEGDICKFREWDNGKMCWIGYVHFEHCQFIISGGANKECPSDFHLVLSRFSSENIEVIGNVHDGGAYD